MKAILLLLMMLVIGAGNIVRAEIPQRGLDPKVAVKLIGLMHEIRTEPISIATIVEGQKSVGKFTVSYVQRVTAVLPVPEGGALVRRVRTYDFYWNDKYGWFLSECREGRGGDEFWVWSELQGELVVK